MISRLHFSNPCHTEQSYLNNSLEQIFSASNCSLPSSPFNWDNSYKLISRRSTLNSLNQMFSAPSCSAHFPILLFTEINRLFWTALGKCSVLQAALFPRLLFSEISRLSEQLEVNFQCCELLSSLYSYSMRSRDLLKSLKRFCLKLQLLFILYSLSLRLIDLLNSLKQMFLLRSKLLFCWLFFFLFENSFIFLMLTLLARPGELRPPPPLLKDASAVSQSTWMSPPSSSAESRRRCFSCGPM